MARAPFCPPPSGHVPQPQPLAPTHSLFQQLSFVSFIARIQSFTLRRPFFSICVCVYIFLSFKKFSKNYINCTRFIGVVSFRSENACFDEKRSPLSLSLFRGRRQMSDGKERKVQHRRCSIVFSFTILRRLSLVLISPNFYRFFLSSSSSSCCITLLSRLIAKARRASERTDRKSDNHRP